MFLTVRNREKIIFEGEVETVTSRNRKGPFDILPQHANFITLLQDVLKVRKKDGTSEEIGVDNGLLRIVGEKATVYLGVKALGE